MAGNSSLFYFGIIYSFKFADREFASLSFNRREWEDAEDFAERNIFIEFYGL